MASAKTYPVFIRFIVPLKEEFKFKRVLEQIAADEGIKEDVFYVSSNEKNNREELEHVIKINFDTTDNTTGQKRYARFVNSILTSTELRKFFPAYVEDPK